ncbi:MAG: efflux RND transporter periplasmic adaptor subunit [Proteobacteria bacterium]|nr:efflux RND transporter periplasmic adaptor subunit [Pseudomonadota bacterium]
MIGRFSKVVLPLAIIAVAALGAVYMAKTRPRVAPQPPQERAWAVAAVPASPVDVRPEMRLFGNIVAGREVELRPLVAGRVVAVGANFVEGGVVRAGELLIAIDPFDYRADVAENEARIAEARARLAEIGAELAAASDLSERDQEQVELSRRQVERRETLRGTLAGSEKALDDARMALSQIEQQAIGRRETIDRLGARTDQQEAVIERWTVALGRARRELERTRLKAPFDGFLVETNAALGKRLGLGDRVARLIDAGRLEARFHLSDAEFARLLAAGGYRDRAAKVVWRIGTQAFTYDAVIDRVESEIDAMSGGVDLYARIADIDAEGVLRPGAFVEVNVADQLYTDVVRLPEQALHDGDTVYAVVDERLVARTVEVVARSGDEVLVRGDLAPDDMVVTTRFSEIGPGVLVAVR